MSDPGNAPRQRPQVPAHVLDYTLAKVARLVSTPSLAAEGRGIQETAVLVRELLEAEGVRTELHDTGGAPVVYGVGGDPSGPTILFYNHYDVQPADPVDAWTSDPWTLTRRGDNWYGRGAADDKGELVARLAAIRWFREQHGELPFQVKFLIEGEEEIGSPNLAPYIAKNAELLAADAVLWEFGAVDAADRPMTYTGLKGIISAEVTARTAKHDLHSGYSPAIENAAFRLASALVSLRSPDGTVLIDGFYDDVRPVTAAEERALQALPDEDEEIIRSFELTGFLGGRTSTALHRQLYLQPVFNINAFEAGYNGPGIRTTLPATARARIDVRLVPDQDPSRVWEQLKAQLAKNGFGDIELRVLDHFEAGTRSDIEHPFVQTSLQAMREVYGQEPSLFPSSFGSGPMYPFAKHIGAPIAGLGIGYPGSRIHGPDEHIRLQDIHGGIATLKRLFELYGNR